MSASDLETFLRELSWQEYIDDEEIKDILIQIKQRAEAIDKGAGDDDDEEEVERIKLVIVGDGAVGKTSLLETYKTGQFPTDYVPTVFENTTKEVNHKGKKILLQLMDTAGQEDYDRLRPLSYPGSDVVLLCYSCISEGSFDAIVEKWHPEVNLYAGGVPQILVGTKYDMRAEGVADPHTGEGEAVHEEDGESLSSDIGAAAFVETSAKTGHNLNKLFELAIEIVLKLRAEAAAPAPAASSPKKSSSSKKSSSKSSSSKKDDKSSSKSSSSKSSSSKSSSSKSSSSKSSSSKKDDKKDDKKKK